MISDGKDRQQLKRRLFEFYGENASPNTETGNNPCDIDSSTFDSKSYLTNLLKKSDLSDLVAKETEIGEQIRSLDSEMQTLVYDNYNKFINATHTIKMMKSDFKFIENEMNSLAESMVELSRLSTAIDGETRENRQAIKKLVTTKENLQKLSHLLSLPSKIREHIKKEEWIAAVSAHCRAKGFFEKHRDVPSFAGIDKECSELMENLANVVETRLENSVDSTTLSSYIDVLRQFGRPSSELSERYLNVPISPHEVERHDPEGLLFECIKSVTYRFLTLVDETMLIEVQDSDTGDLVRSLERLYSRLMAFGRSILEVVTPNEVTDHASDFSRCLNDACLEMVLRFATKTTENELGRLKKQIADCLTGVRQRLLVEFKISPGSGTTSPSIGDIYNDMSRELATNLRDSLKRLEAFLLEQNTFAQIQMFRATFCLENVREGIVVAYLRHLIKFCGDLSRCTPSNIPAALLLLLGKLCLEWANSGTVGHLLNMADDFVLTGLPKSSVSANSERQAISKQMQQMLASRDDPLTPPGPLAEEFRVTAIGQPNEQPQQQHRGLLTCFARFEGAQMAHMIHKSVEARDWLQCLEPRSVRSVVKRILDDLTDIDLLVSQLLPPSITTLRGRVSGAGRGTGSGDGRHSWRSSHARQSAEGLAKKTHHDRRRQQPDCDPALANQLRRLFFQRVDVFAPVEPTRESILFGVIKIGLKAFLECARTRVFGKFGLQQIQVDCHYLHVHLWRFVSDEKQVEIVLDDVMCSVIKRCLEPQLMEASIVDSICDSTRAGSDPPTWNGK